MSVDNRENLNTFALIGAAGYIAPRHMKAISINDGDLLAALDPFDSVGILDTYFPNANFFTEFERFDRYIDKLSRKNLKPVDYISICSPNHLHDSHVRFALRSGSKVICEKPLVLNPWNLDGLLEMERETGGQINTILQSRLHPSIIALKEKINREVKGTKYDVDLTYVTARGNWYQQSWKGNLERSGGIATNIGVHFFDILHVLFGKLQLIELHMDEPMKLAGYLEYEGARVRWFLSLDILDVPAVRRRKGYRTFRSIKLDGREIEFSDGFNDLHNLSYKKILEGAGFSAEDSRTAIDIVSSIRTAKICEKPSEFHPFLLGIKS